MSDKTRYEDAMKRLYAAQAHVRDLKEELISAKVEATKAWDAQWARAEKAELILARVLAVTETLRVPPGWYDDGVNAIMRAAERESAPTGRSPDAGQADVGTPKSAAAKSAARKRKGDV
jgi:hypothetical protein